MIGVAQGAFQAVSLLGYQVCIRDMFLFMTAKTADELVCLTLAHVASFSDLPHDEAERVHVHLLEGFDIMKVDLAF